MSSPLLLPPPAAAVIANADSGVVAAAVLFPPEKRADDEVGERGVVIVESTDGQHMLLDMAEIGSRFELNRA